MLRIQGVKKKYGSFTLDSSLIVPKGCVSGLIGQNGAGKSTTFKAILGLIKKDEGKIFLFGKEIEELTQEDKQHLGVVLSDSGFSGYLTINDILPVIKNLYSSFDSNYFISKCEKFGLPKNKRIKEFSTGMKAKLKIVVATSHDADLLILDEPTAGLDVIARDEVLDMLRDYMEEDVNHTILISSHISSDLESLCDDLYMIHEGRIIFHEDTDVLLSDYALLKVSQEQFNEIDPQYILKVKKESYGYRCLTNQKQYYIENYPDCVVEKGNIDELILMMIKGENNEGFIN